MRRRGTTLWGVVLALWVCVIWGHSLMQGPQSSAESGHVLELLRPLFELVGVHDEDLMGLVVRKLGHFSEFAVLGLLTVRLWHSLGSPGRLLWAAWLLPPAVACMDEALQLLAPGRNGAPLDVLIDCSGALLAMGCAHALARRRIVSG